VLKYGSYQRELTGGFRLTTNNRMEILAAVVALRALKEPCRVILYCDSQYVVRAMTEGWPQRWRAHGWMRTKKEPASNPDLWESLLQAGEPHEIQWVWVRGHAGNSGNERCDRLAMCSAHETDLPVDSGYECAVRRSGGTVQPALGAFETSAGQD
jgi:ribonuclease HI